MRSASLAELYHRTKYKTMWRDSIPGRRFGRAMLCSTNAPGKM